MLELHLIVKRYLVPLYSSHYKTQLDRVVLIKLYHMKVMIQVLHIYKMMEDIAHMKILYILDIKMHMLKSMVKDINKMIFQLVLESLNHILIHVIHYPKNSKALNIDMIWHNMFKIDSSFIFLFRHLHIKVIFNLILFHKLIFILNLMIQEELNYQTQNMK